MIKFRKMRLRQLSVGVLPLPFCVACLLCGGVVVAQTTNQPPEVQHVDVRGMDLGTGQVTFEGPDLSIGSATSGLFRHVGDTGYDNFSDTIKLVREQTGGQGGPTRAMVSYGGRAYRFYVGSWMAPGTLTFYTGPYNGEDGATLACDQWGGVTVPAGSTCTMNLSDGTVVTYDATLRDTTTYVDVYGAATLITHPDGEITKLYYNSILAGTLGSPISITSSLGWMISKPGAVTGINLSAIYCNPVAACSVTNDLPNTSLSYTSGTTTEYRNGIIQRTRVETWPDGNHHNITLTRPSGATQSYQINYPNSPNTTTTVSIGSSAWVYNYHRLPVNGITSIDSPATIAITGPTGAVRNLEIDTYKNITSVTDELGRKTSYSYGNHKITRIVRPEATFSGTTPTGGYTDYLNGYQDVILKVTDVPKVGSGLATRIVTSHSPNMDGTCLSVKSCWKPDYTVDANGKQTDYTYDTTGAHGGILTETGPADATGVRPQTRYSYAQLYPKVLNASGVLVNSTPVWRLTRTSTCRTATAANPAACVGTDQETVTEYEYGSNNLLLTKVTVRAGNANVANVASPTNVWQSTSYDYDVVGNLIMVDGPLPGTVDQSYTVYDVLRRPVYEIGIDPDGAGTLPSVTIHHMYDIDGREYRTETGRGNGANMRTCSPTAATCTYFAVTSYVQRFYDATTGLEVKFITAQP